MQNYNIPIFNFLYFSRR